MRSLVAYVFVSAMATASAVSAADSAPLTPLAAVRTEITTMDTWQVTCGFDKDNHKIGCNAVLSVKQSAAAPNTTAGTPMRVFMVWALSKANDGAIYSSFQTLTGVRVPPGLQLKMDAGQAHTVPFDSCGTSSCIAITKMEPDFVKQASSAKQIQATVQSSDGRAYTATFAPKGIDRAIQAVL
ncbi:MAG: invasion associated locus B family protein [Steroidobacteraceae bacterium]